MHQSITQPRERLQKFFEATLEGEIATRQKGEGGFGYDPLFIPLGEKRTLAEIKLDSPEFETHRLKALHNLITEGL